MRNRVLLIDDSLTIHKIVELTMNRQMFELVSAYTLEEGLKAAESSPAVVMVDGNLAGTDKEFISKLRQISAAGIIMIVAAYDQVSDARMSQVKVDSYLMKPFNATTLNSTLNTALLITPSSVDLYGAPPAVSGKKIAMAVKEVELAEIEATPAESETVPLLDIPVDDPVIVPELEILASDNDELSDKEPPVIEKGYDIIEQISPEPSDTEEETLASLEEMDIYVRLEQAIDDESIREFSGNAFSGKLQMLADDNGDSDGDDIHATLENTLEEEILASSLPGSEPLTVDATTIPEDAPEAVETELIFSPLMKYTWLFASDEEKKKLRIPKGLLPEEHTQELNKIVNEELAYYNDGFISALSTLRPAVAKEAAVIEASQETEKQPTIHFDLGAPIVKKIVPETEPKDIDFKYTWLFSTDEERLELKKDLKVSKNTKQELVDLTRIIIDEYTSFEDDFSVCYDNTLSSIDSAESAPQPVFADNTNSLQPELDILRELLEENDLFTSTANDAGNIDLDFDDSGQLLNDLYSLLDSADIDNPVSFEEGSMDFTGETVVDEEDSASTLRQEIEERHELMGLFDEINEELETLTTSLEEDEGFYKNDYAIKADSRRPLPDVDPVAVGVPAGVSPSSNASAGKFRRISELVKSAGEEAHTIYPRAGQLTIELTKEELSKLLKYSMNKDILEELVKDAVQISLDKLVPALTERLVREELRIIKGG